MSDGPERLESLFEGIDLRDLKSAGEHVDLTVLGEYNQGHCSPAVADSVQAHLVGCRECTELLLDLAAFPAVEHTAELAITDERIDAEWKRFRQSIEREAVERHPSVIDLASVRRRPKAMWWYAIAASLMVAFLLGTVWFITRATRKEQIAQPTDRSAQPPVAASGSPKNPDSTTQAPDSNTNELPRGDQHRNEAAGEVAMNTLRVELYPLEALRGDDDARAVHLDNSTKTVSLILLSSNRERFASHLIEVRNGADGIVWSRSVAFRYEGGTATANIPAGLLVEGVYGVALYGLRGGERKVIDSYRIHFRR